MSIDLVVRPGITVKRAEFLETHPPYSIGLDGYVYGEPFLHVGEEGPFRNFNHHEEVDRSCLTATCEQTRRAVLLGLYDLFKDPGHKGRKATLYVNDCDQDVCLSTWMLMNPDRVAEPLARMLSQIEDLLDTSSGTMPMPHERDLLGQVRWVFEPYVRMRPHLPSLTADGMRGVILDVHNRIDQFMIGRAGHVPLDGTWEQIGGGPGWMFAKVSHLYARERMIASGVRAAVELYGRNGDRYLYTVWRRSEYIVSFPVRDILAALNEAEPGDETWGGADNVGGAPRAIGSVLSPNEVEEVVNSVVGSH